MVCQGLLGGVADGGYNGSGAEAGIGSIGTVRIHHRDPDQASHQHRQGEKHPPKQQRPWIVPSTTHEDEHQQGDRDHSRQHAEEAERLDLEDHQPDQRQAEHRHGKRRHEQPPPGAARELGLVLGQPREQGHDGHHQHREVGQHPRE